MNEILLGNATPAQIAGFVVALRARGESGADLREMLAVVRGAAVPVAGSGELLDIVGTGGDASHSVNVSTMAALVAAGAGARVCKHGNRAASSSCGAADVLEALGVDIEAGPGTVSRCIESAGVGFCFAPKFHPGFRHAGPVRRELGIPTVFNLLGPMANPAPVTSMVVGVADPRAMDPIADALASRGVRRAWVVHGHGGMDELVLSGGNQVVEVADGRIGRFVLEPGEHGFTEWPAEAIRGGSPTDNAATVREVLAGGLGAVRDVVVLNAAAGLLVAGVAGTLEEAKTAAESSIDSGAAMTALRLLVETSTGDRDAVRS